MKRVSITKPGLAVWLLVGATVPWQFGGKQPAALLVSLLLMFLAAFLLVRSDYGEPPAIKGWLWLPVAFLGWAALSMVWSVNRYQSVIWLEIIAQAVIMFFLAYSFGQNQKLKLQWLAGYVAVATASSLWGIVIYLTGNYNRLTSSFYLANPFAAYVLPALLIAVWQWSKRDNWLWGACVPVLAAAFILTDSRSAFLVAAIGVLVAATVRFKSNQWLKLGGTLAASLVLVAGLNFARSHLFHQATVVQGSRFSEPAKGESTSLSDRWNYFKSTVVIWEHYPLLGTGAGTFGTVHPRYQYRVISAANYAHNFYAQALSELGLVGAALLAAMVLAVAAVVVGSLRTKTGRALAVILALAVIHLALDIDAAYPTIMVVVGALAGFAYAAPRLSPKTKSVWPLWGALAATTVLLVPAYGAYLSQRDAAAAAASQDGLNYEVAAAQFSHAHSGLTYDPDVLTGEGINYYSMAGYASKADAKADYQMAQRLALAAQKLDPLDSQHVFLQARSLNKQGDTAGATAAYKRAIMLDPYNHPEYYADLVNLYLVTNRPAEAIATATDVLTQYPAGVAANRASDPSIAPNLSVLYYFRALAEQGASPAQTKTDLKAALRLDPTNNAAIQLLGQLGG